MLKRIYIDNYKSLVNFELSLDSISLFVGANGSGKSAVFEVLQKIRDFALGKGKIADLFLPDNRTRWQTLSTQTFELEVERDTDSKYKYELAIEHDESGKNVHVKYERLWVNQNPLLKFESDEIQLYNDNYSEGPKYPYDGVLSAIQSITPRNDNKRLTWFKEQLERYIVTHPIPSLIEEESAFEVSSPSISLSNYVSWYRHLSQDQGMAYQLTSALRETLPGFQYFKFENVGRQQRLLMAYFQIEDNQSVGYRFSELSDGQRMLIALYTLLHLNQGGSQRKYILCIDEPENFVALPEIQPWLTELYDRCNNSGLQALLISHHPESLNYLLASPIGYWFERQNNGPTRVKQIQVDDEDGLPVSELIARGWLMNE